VNREKGLAYCGLACYVCGENNVCAGCRSLGCKNFESCKHFDCCREKGYNGCWECADFPCGGMHDKVRVRAFVEFVRQNSEEKMLDCLERNEKAGITYHYQGQYEGDYDKFSTVDEVIKMLEG
jgi:hypothetical protein